MSKLTEIQMNLLLFSEWLDSEARLLQTRENDERTHEDLVNEFLNHIANSPENR